MYEIANVSMSKNVTYTMLITWLKCPQLLNHKHNKLFQYETTATTSWVKIIILFQLKYYIHLSCYMTIKLSSVTT